jgi:3'(2'), 5'-bisphosphate nucleotidase
MKPDDMRLARDLAESAGRRLLEIRREAVDLSPGELKRAGDAAAQEVLSRRLVEERPDDAVLSEEAVDDRRRLTADRVWILDPLDGTREFSEGRDDWAVHVALWEQGQLVVGAVALPGVPSVLVSDPAPVVPPRTPGRLRLAVSRTRPPALATVVADDLGLDLLPMGSAGYKIAAIILGEADVYLHGGGQYEWDSAAPVAVARAAGLHTSRLDGSPLVYNQSNVLLPDLIVCRPEIAESVLAAVALRLAQDCP